jgi:probable F420-dependent oxidoreductase
MSRPELGVSIWQTDPARLRDRVRLIEELGFDVVTVPDHLTDGLPPPLIACAAIAAASARVRIGTLVLNNDLRHPAVLAREAAMLAELSGGRFELGLGAGYAKAEYERTGIPYDPGPVRVARMCESLQILRALLAGETVTFAGEHYRITGERCAPVPSAPVPLLAGGNSLALHRCAAAHADALGFVGFDARTGGASAAVTDFGRAAFEAQLARLAPLEAGRAVPLARHVLVQAFEVTDDREGALARAAADLEVSAAEAAASPYLAIGSAAEIAAHMLELHRTLGVARFTVFADKPGAPPLESLAAVIEALRAA